MAAIHQLQTELYPRLLKRILAITPRVVIVMQYRPCIKHEFTAAYGVYQNIDALPIPGAATPLRKLEVVLEQVYAPILRLAAEHKLAVVDLPRSMDPHDMSLYKLQIEPSGRGGSLISRLVLHAAAHHGDRPSTLYYTPCTPKSRGGAAPAVVRAEVNAFSPASPWLVAGEGGVEDAQPAALVGGAGASAAAGGGGGGGAASATPPAAPN